MGLRHIDPRIVRLKDPEPRPIWQVAASILGVILTTAAVSLAAAHRHHNDPVDVTSVPMRYAPVEQALAPTSPEKTTAPPSPLRPVKQARKKTKHSRDRSHSPPVKRHPFFHDPIYVFTDEQGVQGAQVYPLADPPGIVVDLEGTPEPQGSPLESVGADGRVQSVRRRTTRQGVRYIIGLTTPVKRVRAVHEGSVVVVFPLS